MLQILNIYGTFFFFLVIAFPLIGGAILYKGCELFKITGFPFFKCWKIYLAGLLYCYLVIWGLMVIMKPPGGSKEMPEAQVAPILRTILFYGVPIVAIPFLGRDFSRRALTVELIAILLANTVMILVAYLTLPYLLPAESPTPRPTESRGVVGGGITGGSGR
jgi:hypothetical protein